MDHDNMQDGADRLLLRDVRETDLPIFFQQQLDPTANWMAAFTAKDPADRESFMRRWGKILADKAVSARTILFDGEVAGHISKHAWFGEPEISYWLGRPYWGQGIATQALSRFLETIPDRPLTARAANDNVASIRVLKKCGFVVTASERSFANARGEEIEELIMRLDD